MICRLCLQISGKTEGADFWPRCSSHVQPGILAWESHALRCKPPPGCHPSVPRSVPAGQVAAGNVPPVTILPVTSLQPDLRVRTVRARMWLARNNFVALPHPARAVTLPVLALRGAAGP